MNNIFDTHPYYEEIFEFASMTVANMSILTNVAATKTIRELAEFTNEIIKTGNTNAKGTINDHCMTKEISMSSASDDEVITLHDADILFLYLAGVNQKKPKEIMYSVSNKENGNTQHKTCKDDRTSWKGADPTKRFELLASYLIGGSFERYKSHFNSKYGNDPSLWHPELQFFRHLRNGCFHSNEFNITPYKGSPQIDPSSPPVWSNYIMKSDSDMNGKRVLGGFLHLPQIIPFLNSMGKYV
jgi:hypothetical protein